MYLFTSNVSGRQKNAPGWKLYLQGIKDIFVWKFQPLVKNAASPYYFALSYSTIICLFIFYKKFEGYLYLVGILLAKWILLLGISLL